ncbi:uncharacterized protein LOC105390469 [Plutella xylostella]|uniref:uncharacterized protein LOC105390469 n=1 Tax=Plutella xylostella TaxID=51655 RepID=UPI00203317B2|nr:uncharacterized protein LOC105390469 [Plutella xylostella]
MSEEYCDVVRRPLNSFGSAKHLKTHLLYPKLVLTSKSGIVNIINIKPNEESPENEQCFNMEEEIIDTVLQDNILWIVLASGRLCVLDVTLENKRNVELTNFPNYKIRDVRTINGAVYFISESEECLVSHYPSKEIVKLIDTAASELQITVEKVRERRAIMHHISTVHLGGVDVSVDQGSIVVECPITGLKETILSAGSDIKQVQCWGELLVLMDGSSMWLLDLADARITLEYRTEGVKYYPVGTYSDAFYYIYADGKEAKVHSIQKDLHSLNEVGPNMGSLKKGLKTMDSQEMLKTQLRSMVDTAVLPDNEDVEVIKQMKPLFEQIQDVNFLLTSALRLCEYNTIYKCLLYIVQAKIKDNDDVKLIQELCDIMYKADLTEYIIFKGNNSYKEINLFEYNFIQLCTLFITNSDFDLACMCWRKYSDMKIVLAPDDILLILNAIPYNTKIGALIIWLKNFVPSLLKENPFHIDIIVRWTTERVFKLESSSYWPKIGLKFIDEITMVLENSMKTITIRPVSLDDLDVLKVRIVYIMELKEKYKINMLLAELSSQNPTEVSLIMLHRCYTEDLESFLQGYLPTYATRHNFELDDTLRSYVESVAASGGGGVDGTRLRILLNAFRVPSNKLDCLLNVLRYLDVPWDANIHDLAVTMSAVATNDFTSTDTDRALAREIEEELNYATIKVVLKKYNYPMSHTDYLLVIHKIISAPKVDLKDLKTIMNISASLKSYGSLLYIHRCLTDCNTKLALEYFDGLTEKEGRVTLKSAMAKYEFLIMNNNQDGKTIERCYIDFFKGTQLLDDVEITTVENMYHLKNSYDTKFSMNEMYCEDSQNEDSQRSIDVADPKTTDRSKHLARLSRTHHWRNSALFSQLQRICTTSKVRMFTENILSKLENISSHEISSLLSKFLDGTDNSAFLLELSRVFVQLISNCAEEHMYHLTKVLSILNAMINTSIVMKNLSTAWIFHYIYMPMSSFSAEDCLLQFYSRVDSKQGYEYDNDYLASLCNRNDFIPFRLFANMAGSSASVDDVFRHFKDKTLKRIISKVCVLQETDELFLTSMLLMLNTDNVEEFGNYMLDILKGPNESMPQGALTYLASPVVRRVFGVDGIAGNVASYPPQYILKSKYNMTLADIALPDITEETWDVKLVLFLVLKQQPHLSLERLIDLCKTLNVAIDDGLSLQLIAVLTTWNLNYEISNDELGRQQVKVEKDEKPLVDECTILWESIKDKAFLRDILNDFWKNGEVSLHGRLISINPYFYEVYLCIYYMLFGTGKSKEYFLLNFLKGYKRKSSPQQYEFELFSVKGMFPEIGHHRLPFHLFLRDDMWLNLKSEITLETYEQWLPAVALLALDKDVQTAKDMICSNALKQTMKTRKVESTDPEAKDTEPWRLSTREEPLLKSAHRCVRHIANMEWAGACLFYVLQGCGRGADQVAAAQLCYHFAQRWDALQPGNRAVRKMERLHSTLSTRHALHKIEWATEELVQLVTEPTQLIRALYLHPKFVEKMTRFDVNNAANEIADKNGINISSIRIQILENLLEKGSDTKSRNSFGLDNRDLMTAKYILKATCSKMGAIYLSRIAFDEETDFNKHKKLRALQCLMSIVEPDTAPKVTNRKREELWSSLLELFYTINLEYIDMPWAVGPFIQDKTRALRQILEANESNIEGLKLVAELTRLYGDGPTIIKVIPYLLRASLYDEMIPLLSKIHTTPGEIIRKAWRAVLLSPFLSADYPITERQKANCLKTINLLPLCPVIRDEDLKEIWKNCVRCKAFGIGCLVLPYMTMESRQSLPELRRIDRRNLIASLKNLHTDTYLVSGAMFVVENMISKGGYR